MNLLLDAFWRAAAYCLHPKVIGLSLLPLVIAAGLSVGLGYFYWDAAVGAVRAGMESWALVGTLLDWLQTAGAGGLRAVLAPMIVIALAVPIVVVLSLLLVSLFMTPALTRLVAVRRFSVLERKHGGGPWQSIAWTTGCTLVALAALLVSVPLWLVPPLVLVLPPLIWGWLTYRVLSFDVLAEHASAEERRALLKEHRWPLLTMGIIAGYLGAAPSLLWAVSVTFIIFAPVLVVGAIWLYTLVFAFSALWFAHYALAALQRLRAERLPPAPDMRTLTPMPAAAPTALPPFDPGLPLSP